MSKRTELLGSIADTIQDYRLGEIPRPTPEHVEKWIIQFERGIQDALLAEIDYVLKQTYLSKTWFRKFFTNTISNQSFVGNDVCAFWKKVNFLKIQVEGKSQEELLKIFEDKLDEACGFTINSCGSDNGPYIYVDDVIFSGTRVGNDFQKWIETLAPQAATVYILTVATHKLGEWQVHNRLNKLAQDHGKAINFTFIRSRSLENRRAYKYSSEVLWPTQLPQNALLEQYVKEEHRYPFDPRTSGGTPIPGVFSSEKGRQLLERELLLAGITIRSFCKNPNRIMRPLGFSNFGLGFGSVITTFRNCPNNCPLAIWWGDPAAHKSSPLSKWYPLLPRKTYNSFNNIFPDWFE